MYPARSVSATAVAVATTVLLSAQPAQSDTPLLPPPPAGPERTAADRGAERAVRSTDRPSSEAQPGRPRHEPEAEKPDGREQGPAGPGMARDRSLSELLGRLGTLYRESTDAATAYDKATGKLKRQRAKVRKLTKRLDRASGVVDERRSAVGRLARQQYRNSQSGAELPAALRLLLSEHPERMLRGSHAPRHAVSQHSVRLKQLIGRERQRDALAERERKAMAKQRKLSEQRKKHQQRSRNRLRTVERLLATLSPTELARLRQREEAPERRGALPPLPGGAGRLPENPGGPREPGSRPSGRAVDRSPTDPAGARPPRSAHRTSADVPEVADMSTMHFLPCYLMVCGFPYIAARSGPERVGTER